MQGFKDHSMSGEIECALGALLGAQILRLETIMVIPSQDPRRRSLLVRTIPNGQCKYVE